MAKLLKFLLVSQNPKFRSGLRRFRRRDHRRRPCDIKYAGTAPGGVAGFLQVNVIVPTNIQTGNIPLVLTIGNQPSQAGITIAVQ